MGMPRSLGTPWRRNLHLVFSQGFRSASDIDQFAKMMQEMCEIVAVKRVVKGEHGTGRNVSFQGWSGARRPTRVAAALLILISY